MSSLSLLGGLLLLMAQRGLDGRRAELVSNVGAARDAIARQLEADRAYLRLLIDSSAGGASLLGDATVPAALERYLCDHPSLHQVRLLQAATDAPGAPEPAVARAMETAVRDRQACYSRVFPGDDGRACFAVCIPAQPGGGGAPERSVDMLVGVYRCEGLLRQVLGRDILRQHQVRLLDGSGRTQAELAGLEIDSRLVHAAPLSLPGGLSLELSRYRRSAWDWQILTLAALCAALMLGTVGGIRSLQRQVARRRYAQEQLCRARDELERRVLERTAELEQANHRARQQQDQLARVARISTMGEMAAGLAHELNQPLGAISAWAEGCLRLLDACSSDPAALRAALEEVAAQAQRAGRIIHRLRALVAPGQAQIAPADLRQLVRDMQHLLAAEARDHQVELALDAQADLPEVPVESIQIQQVLLNLMRNGIEAMSGAAAPRRLTVACRVAPAGDVEVVVSDTGEGCQPQVRQRIFEPFFTTKPGGMGMGLSISRSIVEAHGGRLWAEPNAPRGLRMHFTLPVRRRSRSCHGQHEYA